MTAQADLTPDAVAHIRATLKTLHGPAWLDYASELRDAGWDFDRNGDLVPVDADFRPYAHSGQPRPPAGDRR